MRNTYKTEWSKKHKKKHLIEGRKGLYREDTLEMYSRWMKMKPGMKIADVGCGLGFLGRTYWRFFGKSGSYTGIDVNCKNLLSAKKMSQKWAKNGGVNFVAGDVYDLPLKENSFDITMCQTLLIHLLSPEKALEEMIRITKPGGLVVCFEPDNVNFGSYYCTSDDLTLEEKVVLRKANLLINEGRKKMGKGDFSLGVKVLYLMFKAGLKEIDARNGDSSTITAPPYKKKVMDWARGKKLDSDKNRKKIYEKECVCFLKVSKASKSFVEKYSKIISKIHRESRKKAKIQVRKKEYFNFSPIPNIIVSLGRKPLKKKTTR